VGVPTTTEVDRLLEGATITTAERGPGMTIMTPGHLSTQEVATMTTHLHRDMDHTPHIPVAVVAAGVGLTTTICVRTGPLSTTCHLHPLHLTSLTTTPHPAITRPPETTTNRGPGQNITIIQQSMTDGVTTDQLTNFCGKRVIVTGEAGDEIKEYRISKLNLLSSHVPD